jgi:phage protein D
LWSGQEKQKKGGPPATLASILERIAAHHGVTVDEILEMLALQVGLR